MGDKSPKAKDKSKKQDAAGKDKKPDNKGKAAPAPAEPAKKGK